MAPLKLARSASVISTAPGGSAPIIGGRFERGSARPLIERFMRYIDRRRAATAMENRRPGRETFVIAINVRRNRVWRADVQPERDGCYEIDGAGEAAVACGSRIFRRGSLAQAGWGRAGAGCCRCPHLRTTRIRDKGEAADLPNLLTRSTLCTFVFATP